jgi:hypothetical protein
MCIETANLRFPGFCSPTCRDRDRKSRHPKRTVARDAGAWQ